MDNRTLSPGLARLAGNLALALIAGTPLLVVAARFSTNVVLPLVAANLLLHAIGRGEGDAVRLRLMRFLRSSFGLTLIAALTWLLAAASWSPVPIRGATLALHMILAAAAILVAAAALPSLALRLDRRWLIAAIAAAAGWIILNTMLDGAPRTVVGLDANLSRLNRAAVALALFTPLLLYWAIAGHQRALVIGAMILVGTAVFLSTSESAKLALLAAIGWFLVARLAPHRAASLLLVATVLVLALAPLLMASVDLLVPEALRARLGYYTLQIRLDIWQAYAEMVARRPLLGFGTEGAFGMVATPEAAGLDARMRGLLDWGHPHNVPLHLWIDLGAVGVLLAVALVVGTYRRLIVLDRDRLAVATGTAVAVFAVALVSHGAWQSWWPCLIALVAMAQGAVWTSGRADARQHDESAR